MSLRLARLSVLLAPLLLACAELSPIVSSTVPPAKPLQQSVPSEWQSRDTFVQCDDRVAPLSIDLLMPRYPLAAEKTGREQRLSYALWVNSDGAVIDLRLLGEADEEFRLAAERAIRHWRFHFSAADAACFVGKPMQLPVQFKMLD